MTKQKSQTRNLFRQNAIDFQAMRLHGDVLVVPKVSHVVMFLVFCMWLLLLMVFLTTNSYARKEQVYGWIEPQGGIAKLYSKQQPGTVSAVYVKEGELVKVGDHLLTIQNAKNRESGGYLEEELLVEFERQQEELFHYLQRQKEMDTLRIHSLTQQIASAQQELVHVSEQISLLNKRHRLISERLARYQDIHSSGALPQQTIEKLAEQKLIVESEVQSLMRTKQSQQNKMSQLQLELELLPKQTASSETRWQREMSELAQKTAQLRSQGTTVIVATRSGRISNLQTTQGQTAQANQFLLDIVPEDAHFEARILLPVRAAGFTQEGLPIELRYDAFPYQKFGLYRGELTAISTSVLLPGELTQTPVANLEPVYLANAKLETHYIDAYGQSIPLKPGMTFSADITLSERSLLEWLFEPIYSLKGRL
ncbi:HlyD family secretion protein [Alteromonas facilis]|uniref:HlyD family secretion protein n=1 Tax=Alteromonas facilis TaxID=2048004 RepID=UPI000C281FF8|nr:HlyD family efflux transporter periplasmic adaptor subunit [Alteromonas facilis]